MSAERITFGVYALDQVLLPNATAKGWAARLAETAPTLVAGALLYCLTLVAESEGMVLGEAVSLAGTVWLPGLRVAVEPVAGLSGLFLVRIGGKAAALATATPWAEGTAWQAEGPEMPEALAAYAAGTLIDTPDGPRAAGDLVAGDVVTTLGNGSRPLRWVGRRQVTPVEFLARPGLRPVGFAPGTVDNDRALLVSPGQRMLIDDWRAAVYFGEDQVLVSALALVDDQAVRQVLPASALDYVVLSCDRHEILLAEGARSESFHPGESGLAGLAPVERAALAVVLPEAELGRRRAAFPIVHTAEARALRLRV